MLDVRNGEMLAMVNQPSFNPNAREKAGSASTRRNRALTDVVEPGSTMKAFTISAALESGKWKPDSKVDTNPGHLPDRRPDHPRRAQSRPARPDRRDHEVEQHRRGESRRDPAERQSLRHVPPLRFRRIDRQRFPRRIAAAFLPIVKALGAGREGDDLLRLRPFRHAAAAGAGLRGAGQRRPPARADLRQGRAESRQRGDRSADRA